MLVPVKPEQISKYANTSDDPVERFWSMVDKSPGRGPLGDCHTWTGYLNKHGYAFVTVFGTKMRAHRYSWMLAGRDLPEWPLVLDHKCKTRHCVNPNHLHVVTQGENSLLGDSPAAQYKRQTHCKNGHELSGDNLVRLASRPNARRCKACTYQANDQFRKNKKGTTQNG